MRSADEPGGISGGGSPPTVVGPGRRLRRWLVSGGIFRRVAFGATCLATVLGLFYAEENWRGKRAWERYRAELESKEARLDWNSFIPAPVPDEQNIFKAAHIQEWLVKGAAQQSESPLSKKLSLPQDRQNNQMGFVQIAELVFVLPGSKVDTNSVEGSFLFEDQAGREQAEKLLKSAIGPGLVGSQNVIFMARAPDEIKPVRLVVEAATTPGTSEIKSLFSINISPAASAFRVDEMTQFARRYGLNTGQTNLFLVSMACPATCWAAADYLAWSSQAEPDFQVIRDALKRPLARMEGNYEQPFARPIPNFVAVRSLAQALAQRAQCYLLLGQPEQALRELTLLHDLRRVLEAPSLTLVATMIDTAVTGLYAEVIADGLRLGIWREPQLRILQQQLNEINLLPLLFESFKQERAGVCRTLETVRSPELNNLFSFGVQNPNFWEKIKNPRLLLLALMPRGWVYQNMKAISILLQKPIETLDLTNQVVQPYRVENFGRELEGALGHFSPYKFLAEATVPNYMRATQTLARNQTMVQEAFVACALERYRLARGQYPDTLEALVPDFATKLPHDIIDGHSLKYRRTQTGGFRLYSIGWNERDDAGTTAKNSSEGDWVWRGAEARSD